MQESSEAANVNSDKMLAMKVARSDWEPTTPTYVD